MKKDDFVCKMKELFGDAGIDYIPGERIIADSIQYIMLISSIEENFGILLPDEFMNYSAIQNMDVFLDSIYELV